MPCKKRKKCVAKIRGDRKEQINFKLGRWTGGRHYKKTFRSYERF